MKKKSKLKKQRCFHCKKKTGILNYKCKCNNIFCTKCRLPEEHCCSYDYKTIGREQLKKTMVSVKASKIIKI